MGTVKDGFCAVVFESAAVPLVCVHDQVNVSPGFAVSLASPWRYAVWPRSTVVSVADALAVGAVFFAVIVTVST